jgi:hypothetical protein
MCSSAVPAWSLKSPVQPRRRPAGESITVSCEGFWMPAEVVELYDVTARAHCCAVKQR